MPETEDESLSLGGPDTHIPALDDAPEPEVTEVPEADAVEEAPEAEVAADEAPEDALLQQYAKRMGLDPSDPAQRKTLDTVVAKEKYIVELKAKLAAQDTAQQQANQPLALTKWEQEQEEAQQQQQAPSQGDDTPRMPSIGQYNDVGQQWNGPQDAYQTLSDAWTHAAQTGDYRPVIATEAALYERRFDAIGLPKVQQMVEARLNQFFQDRFGAVMPVINEQAAERRASSAAEFAFGELQGTEGYNDIRSLDHEQEGPPLLVNGEQFRNTPLNKILAENPWIMHIKRDHADPQVADRLTYLARLKAAHKIFNSGQISSQKAKALVDAGTKAEQRKQQDQVRQSLNKGGTPSRSLDKGTSKPKTYMQELLEYGDNGPMSFSEL